MENQSPPNNTNGDESPQRSRLPWRLIIGLAAIGALVFVGREQLGELKRLRDVDPWYVVALVVLFLLARLVNGEILVQTLRTIGHHLGRKEALMVTFLRTYASMLIPRAGSAATGVYLKTTRGVRYAEFAALTLPIALVQCCAIGAAGLGCLAVLSWKFDQSVPPVFAGVFAFSLVAGAAALLVHIPVPKNWSGRIANFARRLSQAWRQLRTSRSLLGRLLCLHFTAIVLRAVRLQIAFWSVDVSVSFLSALVVSLLADAMFLVSFTPNGLGFRETAIVYGARVAGATTAEALAAAILDRLVVTATVIVAAQICLWRMPASPAKNGNREEIEEAVQES